MTSHKLCNKGGASTHPIYNAYHSMKQRCLNTKRPNYKDYGGRGITICERWMNFENFVEDLLPTWQKGLSLDRINNDGNYEPGNCRWATKSENTKNRRVKSSTQSKYEGVGWDKRTESWAIKIQQRHFETEEEAGIVASKLKDYLKSIT